MKKYIFQTKLILASLMLLPIFSWAQQERVCSSKVTSVNVFLNQAQVHREGKLALEEGVNLVVFDKISPQLIQGSIEVEAVEGVEILSVGVQTDYFSKNNKPTFILNLEDSLRTITEHLAEIKADKEALVLQKELLLANKNLGGSTQGVKADELEDVLLIYQKKLQEFKFENIRLNRLERTYLDQKVLVENQLQEYTNGTLSLINQIVVQVRCSKPLAEAKFGLKYLVNGVSWQAFYDVRVKDTKNPMQFVLKANLTQNTGEVWENVKLKLTTANPMDIGVKPILEPTRLYLVNNSITEKDADGISEKMDAPAAYRALNGNEAYTPISQPTQTLLNLEFDVAGLSTIPSDSKTHLVELYRFSLPASYGYACVPKLNSEVFVTAKVQTNELISQLNGEANVYLNGTYTGKTFLSDKGQDSLTITLGKEHRVIVKREKVKEMCSKSLFGSTKKEASTIEITLTNSSNETIEVALEDQIPVPSNKEIEVKLGDIGDAKLAVETGQLSWTKKLAPKQTIKVRFSFEISYPSNKIITGY
ncbi:MAG: hypothetical protein CFE21_11955 [Bacteroidetes bacterium B1(2017)]|nr:MAG: hypothetical protein CFE21_11955 [Bacteroidetes bacterium B1(2017)]